MIYSTIVFAYVTQIKSTYLLISGKHIPENMKLSDLCSYFRKIRFIKLYIFFFFIDITNSPLWRIYCVNFDILSIRSDTESNDGDSSAYRPENVYQLCNDSPNLGPAFVINNVHTEMVNFGTDMVK